MPDLDAEPNDRNGEELLAEFNIGHDRHNQAGDKHDATGNEHVSLNCVLPSISDPNDDVTISDVSLLTAIVYK